jgi:cytochrome c556
MPHAKARTSRMTMKIGLGAALLACSGLALAATATQRKAIETRHANYKKMGGAFKTIKDELDKSSPSRATIVAAAQTLATVARQQPRLFPAGTGPGPGVKTDALASIWTKRAEFDAAMKANVTETAKLLAVARTGDTAAMSAQFRATGKTCGDCHKPFRADD